MIETRWTVADDGSFTDADLAALNAIDDVGIRIDCLDARPDDRFLLHRDRHGSPDADSVILWFETEADFRAFGEVTSRATEDEFGCDWAYIYPTGLRAEWITGRFAAAVPRSDLQIVAALMHRELAGEFNLTPRQASRRMHARWFRRIQLVLFMVLAVQMVFFPDRFTGWGWAGMACAGIGWAAATMTLQNPRLRVHLDAIRTRQAVAS